MLYHDWEAETYDDKWSISYDQRCIDYARGRFDAIVPEEDSRDLPYDRALELGCGTGFFLLNLIQAGVARRGSVTDLSPGMVKVATRNGQSLGLDIDGRVADAEGIPYDDDTFDLVVGHAVLHHIPDVELSLREVVRVLKPGGRFVFAGEPTTVGNAYARTLGESDLERHHPCHEAARARQLAAPAGRARRELACRGPGVDRRPAHLRSKRPGEDGDQRRRRRGPHRHRGVHRGDARLAGPHLRVDGAAGQARLGLGQVRVRQLDDAELGGRQRLAPRRAQGLVLQRHGDRGQAVVDFRVDDVAYLRSEAGARALREVADYRLTDATLVADIASARTRFGDRAPALVETTLLRRKAAAKFADPSSWLFTDEALQQATAEPVAAHRARRLAGAGVHDVTCSIGTELAALRNSAAFVVGSDIDPVRLAMARHNVSDVDVCRADALHPVSRDTVVVADPARRHAGRRRFDPRDYTPALDRLLDVYRGRDLVVKVAPGIDFEQLQPAGFRR